MIPKKQFVPRFLEVPHNYSFFLFGARNTGKSTWLRQKFTSETTWWIDLLNLEEEERFARSPQLLASEALALPDNITHIVIDEIQKVPKLLDVVHQLIELTDKYFVMTGSSARKLKCGGANLLAGRAFVFNFFPFSFLEIESFFDLNHALQWGMLPGIYHFNSNASRISFLQAYTRTYLKEEIWGEQLVKNLDPFRRFLEVAAQCNSKIINYSNISRDVGIDDKTVKEYFTILEDTLLGFFLEPFSHSFRKRLSLKPKFYFFDVGIVRGLTRTLSSPIISGTSLYGECFEHFIILECFKLANYYYTEYRFSYLKTKDDLEVDLVIERPGQPLLFIEIKSASYVNAEDLRSLIRVKKDFPTSEFVCFANISRAQFLQQQQIMLYPWKEGIRKYFMDNSSSTVG
jgi:predicted AAA+ superfamily ATPase